MLDVIHVPEYVHKCTEYEQLEFLSLVYDLECEHLPHISFAAMPFCPVAVNFLVVGILAGAKCCFQM